jgi:hypothetical protein
MSYNVLNLAMERIMDMTCCKCKVVLSGILSAILLTALVFTIITVIDVIESEDIQGIQAELNNAGGDILADGANVIFNSVLNDQSDIISYNPLTGEFTVAEPGNYLVTWWFSPDGAGPATTIDFAVAVNNIPYSITSSPIVSVQMASQSLVTIETAPAIITLVNVTGEDVFIPTTSVQAGIVITNGQ